MKGFRLHVEIFLLLSLVCTNAFAYDGPLLSGYLTFNDKTSLKLIAGNLLKDADDIKNVHYAVNILKLLKTEVVNKEKLCTLIEAGSKETSIETVHHSFASANLLQPFKCQLNTNTLDKLAQTELKSGMTASNLAMLTAALSDANKKINAEKVAAISEEIYAKDTSATTQALLINAVVNANCAKPVLKKFFDRLPEIVGQGDVINDIMMSFENGLYSTSLVSNSIIKLITAYGEVPKGLERQLVQLTNFLIARRQTVQPRAISHSLTALHALSTNSFITPIALVDLATVDSGSALASQGSKPGSLSLDNKGNVEFRLTTPLNDGWLSDAGIQLTTGQLRLVQKDKETSVTNGKASVKTSTKDTFILSITSGNKALSPGFYTVELTGTAKGSKVKYAGLETSKIHVKSLTKPVVKDLEIKVIENSGDNTLFTKSLKDLKSDSDAINLEAGQRVVFSLYLGDTSGNQLRPHQVFLQFTNSQTQRQVTFISEQRKSSDGGVYYFSKVDLDLSSEEFDHQSGIYFVNVLAGDSLFDKSLTLKVASAMMKFDSKKQPALSGKSARFAEPTGGKIDIASQQLPSTAGISGRAALGNRELFESLAAFTGENKARPDQLHIFREADKRAPASLAMLFTAACCSPLAILIIGWLILRINIWNFSFRPSALLFHAGLISIFVLYGFYWLRLDMFTTLRILICLAIPTFIAGNCNLRQITKQRYLRSTPLITLDKKDN